MSVSLSLRSSTNSIGDKYTMFSRSLATFAALAVLCAALPPATSAAGDTSDTALNSHCIGCDMSRRDLHGRDLHGARYIGTDLHETNLRDADMHDAQFIGVNLRGAHLERADLRNGSFTGVNFRDAALAGAHFTGIRITGAEFSHDNFTGVDTAALLARCVGCNISYANLDHADLHDVSMIGSDFHNATLRNANAAHASLIGADFRSAHLERASFNGAWLCGGSDRPGCADLDGAHVEGADFRNVRWCDRRASSCRAATLDELRRYTHNQLTGAIVS
jgi:uncharacterized protein YjbI with pentapeptide repeats